jgi:polyhydroxybutyrate depolymerase
MAALAAVVASSACKKDSSSSGGSSGHPGDPADPGGGDGTNPPNGGTLPDGGPAPVPEIVTVTNETMTFGGMSRLYILAIPKNYDASKSYPLVLSFHGNPANAKAQADNLPFHAVSGQEAVIAYPQAASADSGAFSWDLYTPPDSNADFDFIKALIDEIKTNKANIDKTKVLGFGYSGGAFFISQYACQFGGVFKAISINAGGGPDQLNTDKRPNGCFICPAGPVPTIVTHGAADQEVSVDSGEFTAACYAATNGCADTTSATTPAPCVLADGCPTDKPLKKCIIPGLGHAPWDGAMREAWAFFKALP